MIIKAIKTTGLSFALAAAFLVPPAPPTAQAHSPRFRSGSTMTATAA